MLKGNTLRHIRFTSSSIQHYSEGQHSSPHYIQFTSINYNAIKQCEPSEHINRINADENMLILMNDDGMILEDVTTLNVKRMFTASRIHLY